MQRAPSGDPQRLIDAVNQFFQAESEYRMTGVVSSEQSNLPRFANSMLAGIGVYMHPWWQCRFDRHHTTKEPIFEGRDLVSTILLGATGRQGLSLRGDLASSGP